MLSTNPFSSPGKTNMKYLSSRIIQSPGFLNWIFNPSKLFFSPWAPYTSARVAGFYHSWKQSFDITIFGGNSFEETIPAVLLLSMLCLLSVGSGRSIQFLPSLKASAKSLCSPLNVAKKTGEHIQKLLQFLVPLASGTAQCSFQWLD